MQDSVKFRPALVLGAATVAVAIGFGAGFALKRSHGADSTPPLTVAEPPAVTSIPPIDPNTLFLIPVTDGQPQRGPKDALVTVVEWCDLRGEPCRAADAAMTGLMSKYEGTLRWVHRHHVDSRDLLASHHMHAFARGAFQAPEPDKPELFWKVREQLLKLPGDGVPSEAELRRIAGEVGVDYAEIEKGIATKVFDGSIVVDTKFEPRFGVAVTPAFFVNGRRVPLGSKVDKTEMARAIDALIQTELVSAKKLLDSGVPGNSLYNEITKDGRWAINEDRSKRGEAKNAAEAAMNVLRAK